MVCALEVERRALAGLERPGVEIHVSGMGADAASALAERLTVRPLRGVIATGFCGALTPSLRVGDVIVGEQVIHENTGRAFDADPLLLAAAEGRRGTIISAEGLARTPADRAALHGLAVDLESAALARAAHDAEIPFLAIRAVSDRYRDHIPDITGMLDHVGRPNRRRLALFVARHPRDLPRLGRLAHGANRAGHALAGHVGALLTRIGT